jgi:hypothetical protein
MKISQETLCIFGGMTGTNGLNRHNNHILIQIEHSIFKIEPVNVVENIQQKR